MFALWTLDKVSDVVYRIVWRKAVGVLYESIGVHKERSSCQGCGAEVRNVLHLYLLIMLPCWCICDASECNVKSYIDCSLFVRYETVSIVVGYERFAYWWDSAVGSACVRIGLRKCC